MIEQNKIYNGDCLELIKKLPNNSINAIITDPPYFLGVTHNGQKGNYSDLIIMKPFFDNLFSEFKRVLKEDGFLYMCCDWRTYPFFYPVLEQYLDIKNLIVWYKGGCGGNQYMNSHEFIMFCSKGGKINIGEENTIRTIPGFSTGAKKTNGNKIHPTQKPIELFEKFILNSTNEGDVVLDCFGGSGTLAIAAMKTKRNYIIFELQDKYCKIANDRIKDYLNEVGSQLKFNT